MKMQISAAVKLTFCREKKNVCGREKKLAVQKIGSTGFSSALNTHRTNEACSYTVIAHLGHVIVNAVICRYSHRLATGLNAVILTRFCTVFWLTKIKCYKSFDSYFFLGAGAARFQSFSFKSISMPVGNSTSEEQEQRSSYVFATPLALVSITDTAMHKLQPSLTFS